MIEKIKSDTDSPTVILCFVAHYLPGYRSGGPVRTIANLVNHLGDEFDIRIVTRDRDAMDTKPYEEIVVDEWNKVGKAQVFYASKSTLKLNGVARLLRETPHDLLYLNSFFAFDFSILPLLARRIGLAPRKPCVIAPRGEFSTGAIRLKVWKKRLYVFLARQMGLYRGLKWQASSEFEKEDIVREFDVDSKRIRVVVNLPPYATGGQVHTIKRKPGPLRLIFLSRISPMKNLDFVLRVLARVKSPVELTIYGPLKEQDYWKKCQILMRALPQAITVRYAGEVHPTRVSLTFAAHDLFVFPTRGENYGHVVLESLTAGTPVLISDQTPWQDSGDKAVQVLPLIDENRWVAEIDQWAELDDEEMQRRSEAAYQYSKNYLDNNGAVEKNRRLFIDALRDECH